MHAYEKLSLLVGSPRCMAMQCAHNFTSRELFNPICACSWPYFLKWLAVSDLRFVKMVVPRNRDCTHFHCRQASILPIVSLGHHPWVRGKEIAHRVSWPLSISGGQGSILTVDNYFKEKKIINTNRSLMLLTSSMTVSNINLYKHIYIHKQNFNIKFQ